MDLVELKSRTSSQEKFLRRLLEVKADKFSLPADMMNKMGIIDLEDTRHSIGKQLGYIYPFFIAYRKKDRIVFERRLQNRELGWKSKSIIGICEKCGQKFAYGSGEGQCQSRFRNKAQQINDSVLLCDECKKEKAIKLYDGNIYSLEPERPAKKRIMIEAVDIGEVIG
ncbi:hypothetical protein DRH29_03265 [candidate division Kazan bacterium]|uniref:Uncharacterized protein n=1 Tax=candidate division Kazan bacterium TaxID=2202143 RepID=A0A420ZCB0_UNCK3|nr:MAG: hypothetical protein DRH29_03265 [candidate division Kazan bacterium]